MKKKVRDREVAAIEGVLERAGIESMDANGTVRLAERVAILARRKVIAEGALARCESSRAELTVTGEQEQKDGESPLLSGWQGTEPAEGTRRHLIREALVDARLSAMGCSTDRAWALKLADAVESALLSQTIDEEDEEDEEGDVLSVVEAEVKKALNHLILAMQEYREIAPHVVDLQYGRSIRKAIIAVRQIAEPDLEPAGDSDSNDETLEEACDRLHEQRESARVGESTAMAQRDAALHLLRWLIGDLIPPELVGLHTDDDEQDDG